MSGHTHVHTCPECGAETEFTVEIEEDEDEEFIPSQSLKLDIGRTFLRGLSRALSAGALLFAELQSVLLVHDWQKKQRADKPVKRRPGGISIES